MMIVSPCFAGLSRLKRHKLVNAAMRPFLEPGGGVHAVTFKCKTPEEIEAVREKEDMEDGVEEVAAGLQEMTTGT